MYVSFYLKRKKQLKQREKPSGDKLQIHIRQRKWWQQSALPDYYKNNERRKNISTCVTKPDTRNWETNWTLNDSFTEKGN